MPSPASRNERTETRETGFEYSCSRAPVPAPNNCEDVAATRFSDRAAHGAPGSVRMTGGPEALDSGGGGDGL
jgi:hypothetical protein